MHAQEISTAGPSPSTNPGVIGGSTDLKKGHFHRTSKKCGKCALRCKQTVFTALGGKWFCQSFKLDQFEKIICKPDCPFMKEEGKNPCPIFKKVGTVNTELFCHAYPDSLANTILLMDKDWVVRISPAKDAGEPSIPS